MLTEQQQRILGYFIEEAKDHLNTIEQGLLKLQETIDDSEMLREVYRAAHSIKGGAGMLGLHSIQKTSHLLEDCFKILEESPVRVDQKLESLFLRVSDALKELVEQLQGPFGLTEDVATEVMSSVQPVFAELEQHLSTLVKQPDGSAKDNKPTGAHAQTEVLTTVFKQDVMEQLRQMLQLFKPPQWPQSRPQLEKCCGKLRELGDRFDLPTWNSLVDLVSSAISNPEQPCQALASVAIKELKQAQELVIAGRAAEISPGQQLLAMQPPPPIEEPLLADNFDELLEIADDSSADADWLQSEIDSIQVAGAGSESEDTSFFDFDAPSSPPEPKVPAPPISRFSLNQETTLAAPADPTGPEVGAAELNSLADLFEEATDLEAHWHQDQGTDTTYETLPERSNVFETDGETDDFSDLFDTFSEPATAQAEANTEDDPLSLFGDDFLEEDSSELGVEQSVDLEGDAEADDLTDLFEIADQPTSREAIAQEDLALFGEVFPEFEETSASAGTEELALEDDLALFGEVFPEFEETSASAGTEELALEDDFGLFDEEFSETDNSQDGARAVAARTSEPATDNLSELFAGLDEEDWNWDENSAEVDDASFGEAAMAEEPDLVLTEADSNLDLLEDDTNWVMDGDEAAPAAAETQDLTDFDESFSDELDSNEAQEWDSTFQMLESETSLSDFDESFSDELDSNEAQEWDSTFQMLESETSLTDDEEWFEDTGSLLEEEPAAIAVPVELSQTSSDSGLFDLADEAPNAGNLEELGSEGLSLDDFFSLDSQQSDNFWGETTQESVDLGLDGAFGDSWLDASGDLFSEMETPAVADVNLELGNDVDGLDLGFASDPSLDLFGDSETVQPLEAKEDSTAVETQDLAALEVDDLSEWEWEDESAGTPETNGSSDDFDLDFPTATEAGLDSFDEEANALADLEFEAFDLLEEEAAAASNGTEDDSLDWLSDITADFDSELSESFTDDNAALELSAVETPNTAADLDGLDAFDELEAMLGEAEPVGNGNGGQQQGQEAAVADDFASLEALLDDEEPTPPPAKPAPASSPSPATSAQVEDEFAELEDLLEDAGKLGGPPVKSRAGAAAIGKPKPKLFEQTMKVPVKHLDNLTNLVGELVVNRNTLEQDQERLRQFLDNLLHQVQNLSEVGSKMQDLYERSLLEASLLASRRSYRSSSDDDGNSSHNRHATGLDFDPTELDRFTKFHEHAQEMIELIVRVRESTSDIEFIVDETEQVSRQFRQVSTQLQEGLTRARMVPFAEIERIFPLARAVRDGAAEYGKQAEVRIEGRETLIDKLILEHLSDPLKHLINNAIAHGLETPEVRKAAGKSPVGRITICAFHQGNQTVISFSDDGAGIDVDTVKTKAVQKGLITVEEAKTFCRLDFYELLYHPGFSTKDKADLRAGKGVGMDVIRNNVSEIRGVINTDSTPGKGTTFTIRLPLTLSICKALCCVSDKARIAFPMDGVEDALDVPKDRVQVDAEGNSCIVWRDSVLPFRPMTELLSYNRQLGRGSVYGANKEEEAISIVVLRSAGNFLAVQVDQVLGEQEIVIKQLEGPMPKPVGIAGATVLGDGRIMPIGDVLELVDLSLGRLRKESSTWDMRMMPAMAEVQPAAEPTVLIVDDSITVRELLSMTFNKVGYRVEQARDGQEAWDKLKSGLPCDIVFCDIEMPRMDGLELLSRMHKDPDLRDLPIAMLTSRGAEKHRQTAVELGASGYFTKPYLEDQLLDAAARMLKGEKLVTSSVNA